MKDEEFQLKYIPPSRTSPPKQVPPKNLGGVCSGGGGYVQGGNVLEPRTHMLILDDIWLSFNFNTENIMMIL